MKSNFGTAIDFTLFGESHGPYIGITIQGIPAGKQFDFTKIETILHQRAGGASFNTKRQEEIQYEIISGYFEQKTTGTPLTIIFPNTKQNSKDYQHLLTHPRPGHADYTAQLKYNNNHDYRGGGHFSGRLTVPIVFLGAMVEQLIISTNPDYCVCSHIQTIGNLHDDSYYDLRDCNVLAPLNLDTIHKPDIKLFMDTLDGDEWLDTISLAISNTQQQIKKACMSPFPLLNPDFLLDAQNIIKTTQEQGDTLGGKIETIILNPPIGIGEPYFHSVESTIASLLFSIGSIKGVDFGLGQEFARATGSSVKDEILQIKNGRIQTLFNYNGGINGGITNGEDVVLTSTFKAISSLMQEQYSFEQTSNSIQPLHVNGRHDVTIVNRIIPIIHAVINIAVYDLLQQQNTNK